MLQLGNNLVEEIKDLARKSYPCECGGFLAGKSGPPKEVSGIYPLENQNKSTPRVRFEIDPVEFKTVEDQATKDGLELLVFYHSHPDHPAMPSDFDTERAAGLAPFWPELYYLIVSVAGTRDSEFFEFSCWVFHGNSGNFEKEELILV